MSQFPPNPPGPPGPTPPPQPGWQGPPPQQPQGGGYPPNVPPAQWPQQGGPPSGGGNKTGLFVVVGLLVVAAIGGGIFLLTSGDDSGGGGGGGSSPEGAVRSFVEAAQDEDCGAFIDSVTEASWAFFTGDLSAEPGSVTRDEAVDFCEENISGSSGFFDTTGSIDDIEVTEESGDTATVAVTSTSDGEQTTEEVPVAREGGKWRVDFAGVFSDLGDIDSEDLDTDFTVPEDIDSQIEDLEEQLEEELGTDFTIPEP